MGRAAAIARSRAAEQLFVKSISKGNWEKIAFVAQQLCCKRYETRGRATKNVMVTYGRFLSKRLRPCSTHQVEASGQSTRGGDRHGTIHPSSRALRVELSDLASSIPGMGPNRVRVEQHPKALKQQGVKLYTMYRHHTNQRRSSSEKPIPGTREKSVTRQFP